VSLSEKIFRALSRAESEIDVVGMMKDWKKVVRKDDKCRSWEVIVGKQHGGTT
jgi:hypothetical protein